MKENNNELISYQEKINTPYLLIDGLSTTHPLYLKNYDVFYFNFLKKRKSI
jgi:hypothetical protein